ncbi:MAG TPA: alanine--tRNA ligase [Candidatus Omnitrophota bacterium]|nr:alanine--tRNA ligase [Candidatus Omnitrophota bacterium]
MKTPTTTNELRSAFLQFFESKAHKIIASDSLVPQNDPSLLFTGAGMNQFKEYFLGAKKDLKRATTSQKCLRTGDLDEVGRTPFHHSFFEMLGNFSFGDYFKKEAIEWAWEFLTEILQIPKERLRITVHEKDQEAFSIWHQVIGLPKDWIYSCGDQSNFWPANAPALGPNGPCGPCSEVYFDQNPAIQGTPLDDSGKFAEIWNLVFTQYDRQDNGKLVPLKNKNIDTGMGLERLACVLQGKASNFEIDIFVPIHHAILQELSLDPQKVPMKKLYCISDHLRAVVFSSADGVVPSNEGRGYVIRKLIRRAIWQAHQFVPQQTLTKPFLFKAVPTVIKVMETAYPELRDAEENIRMVLSQEEERFLKTLEDGLQILKSRLEDYQKKKLETVPAETVFELYDTYGFPEELTRGIAQGKGLNIDRAGFEKLMENQRMRSKESSKISAEIFSKSDLEKIPSDIPATQFLGYELLETKAKVLWHQKEGKQANIILDQTPFYAESGGQIGDQGMLEGIGLKLRVVDVQKLDKYFLHHTEILEGAVSNGLAVNAVVNRDRREGVMRNHTATHLLHAALREILGNSVRQLGSLVAADRFRFDYSFGRALTQEELRKIERIVNEQILKNLPVHKGSKNLDEAKKEGALAFFGDKYGDKVRVISIPEFSKELCGGTHCDNTGQIGMMIILGESSVASGVRRIEAVTGTEAMHYVQNLKDQISEISRMLKVGITDIPARIAKLMENLKKQKTQDSKVSLAQTDISKILSKAKKTGSCLVCLEMIESADMTTLRNLSDILREKGQRLIFVIATCQEAKLHVIIGKSADLKKSSLDMKDLFDRLSTILNISGGGRHDLVQGGGPDQGQFLKFAGQVEEVISGYMIEKGM